MKNIITNSILYVGGNLHIGDSIYNIKETLQTTILFLRIKKKEQEQNISVYYSAHLEIKSKKSLQPTQPITQTLDLELNEVVFRALRNFEDYRIDRQSSIFQRQGLDGLPLPNQSNSKTDQNLEWERQLGVGLYDLFLPPDSDLRVIVQFFIKLLVQRKIENLTFIISSPDAKILNIPLEMMRPNVSTKPLALSYDNLSIIHSLEEKLPNFEVGTFQAVALPLRILFVTALPDDLQEGKKFIDLEREQERLIEILGDLPAQKKVMVEFLEIGSLEAIQEALKAGQHHIVHISGHGLQIENEEGEQISLLCMEDEEGNKKYVEGQQLAGLLAEYNSVKMVLLSACQTGRAEEFGLSGALLRAGIPAVLGMHYSIGDVAATLFTSTFYEHLCQGKTLSQAVFYARKAVETKEIKERQYQPNRFEISEWFTPFLYLNQYMGQWMNPNLPVEEEQYFYKHFRSSQFFSGIKSIRLKSSGRIKVDYEQAKLVGQGFVGRRKQLARLTNLLKSDVRALCIHGIGGIGKTSLAARFLDNYYNKGFQILLFEGEITEHQVLLQIAQQTPKNQQAQFLQIVNDPHRKPEQKRRLLLSSLKQCILFFDNFEDNQIVPKSDTLENTPSEETLIPNQIRSEALHNFLLDLCDQINEIPVKQQVMVLFTTRYFPIEGLPLHGEDLNKFSFSDAYKLMSRLPKLHTLLLAQRRAVHKRLGGHPRALELLHSYLRHEATVTWQTIKSKFEPTEQYLVKHDLLLTMLWELLTEEEQYVLSVASIFRQLTPKEGLVEVSDRSVEVVDKALQRLQGLSLVYLEGEEFEMYKLTQSFLKRQIIDFYALKNWSLKATCFYENWIIEKRASGKPDVFKLRWYALQAKKYSSYFDASVALSHSFQELGHRNISIALMKAVLSDVPPNENKTLALANFNLGLLLQYFNCFDEALNYLNTSIQINQKLNECSSIVDAFAEIANIYKQQKRNKLSYEVVEKTFQLFPNEPQIIFSNLYYVRGHLFLECDAYQKAIVDFNIALNLYKKKDDLLNIGTSMHSLGMCYENLNDYEKSRIFYEKALGYFSQKKHQENLGNTYYHLGIVMTEVGKLTEAKKCYHKAVSYFKTTRHLPHLRNCYDRISVYYQDNNELRKALDFRLKAMKIEKQFGNLECYTISNFQLGNIFEKRKEFSESLKHYTQSLILFEHQKFSNVDEAAMCIARLFRKVSFGEILTCVDEIKRRTGRHFLFFLPLKRALFRLFIFFVIIFFLLIIFIKI